MTAPFGDRLCELEALVRCGTLANAARELGLSESALSRHLASLETDLGTKLVTRGPAGVRLTDQGRFAYDAACQIKRAGQHLEASLNIQPTIKGAAASPNASNAADHGTEGARAARTDTRQQSSGNESRRHLHVCGLEESAFTQRAVRALQGLVARPPHPMSLHLLGNDTVAQMARSNDNMPSRIARLLASQQIDLAFAFRGAADRIAGLFKANDMTVRSLGAIPCVAVVNRKNRLSSMSQMGLFDLRDQIFARYIGISAYLDATWEELSRRCEISHLSPLTRTMGYEMTPGFAWDDPSIICVVTRDNPYLDNVDMSHSSIVAIADLALEVCAVYRRDDMVMVNLFDRLAFERKNA